MQTAKDKTGGQMLQICFGIYAVLAMFTLLLFVGTLVDAQRDDKGGHTKSRIK